MAGVVALDSCILIALLDADDEHHEHAKQALSWATESRHELTISAVTAMEIAIGPIRSRGEEGARRIDDTLAAFPIRVIPIDAAVARRAARLRAAFPKLRTPDALVVASGLECGAECLITTDERIPSTVPLPLRLAHRQT